MLNLVYDNVQHIQITVLSYHRHKCRKVLCYILQAYFKEK